MMVAALHSLEAKECRSAQHASTCMMHRQEASLSLCNTKTQWLPKIAAGSNWQRYLCTPGCWCDTSLTTGILTSSNKLEAL
jgi:hypothetical protein